jgi:hypothetical protein
LPEINNSLALGIKNDPIDIGKTLLQAGQINQLRASTQNTLADTAQKRFDLMGRLGNAMQQDPERVADHIKTYENAYGPVDPQVKDHLLNSPPSEIIRMGKNLQQGAMQSETSKRLDPAQIAQRSQADTGGAKVGGIYGPPGYQGQNPSSPPGIKDAAPGAAPNVTLQDVEKEGAAEAENSAKIYNDVQAQATAAQPKKVALNQMLLDAQRVRTGAGAEKEQGARKWLLALGDTVPILKGFTERYRDSATAFDSLDKNAGLVARDAMKGVGGTAASELQAISSTLANHTTQNGGIEVNVRQLYGLESANQGKLNAAELYKSQYGTMKGFTGWYQKNAGPAAWVFDALPSSEKQIIVDDLNKTDKGKEIKASLVRQINFIRKNNLHQGAE